MPVPWHHRRKERVWLRVPRPAADRLVSAGSNDGSQKFGEVGTVADGNFRSSPDGSEAGTSFRDRCKSRSDEIRQSHFRNTLCRIVVWWSEYCSVEKEP